MKKLPIFLSIMLGTGLTLSADCIDDYADEVTEWEKEAVAGDTTAMINLGTTYMYGIMRAIDLKKAEHYLRMAYDAGSDRTVEKLAVCYANDTELLREGDTETIRVVTEGANRNIAPAQTALGQIYLNGYGTVKNPQAAIEWLRKAADNGDAVAFGHLGKIYEEGETVDRDLPLALRYYEKAFEMRLFTLGYKLGMDFYYGTGIAPAKDYVKAARYLSEFIGKCRIFRFYGMTDEMRESMFKAHVTMSILYRRGRGVDKDTKKADRLIIEAVEYADPDDLLTLKAMELLVPETGSDN